MREIKFRAWHSEMERMYYGKLDDMQWRSEVSAVTKSDIDENYSSFNVMQFTGLKDKNGKEIYEGDVVEYETYNGKFIGKIVFEAGMFIMACDKFADSYKALSDFSNSEEWCEELEILGDVHQNPDLLESEEGESN